jgi:hypothetical protein
MTIEEIREFMKKRYHDAEDDESAIQSSGHVHEHALIALGIVLLSSVALGSTDVDQLVEFTQYSRKFIGAIARNMENSRLWRDGKYDAQWSSESNVFPRDENEDRQFWDDIHVAEGTAWTHDTKSEAAEDPCATFWKDKAS